MGGIKCHSQNAFSFPQAGIVRPWVAWDYYLAETKLLWLGICYSVKKILPNNCTKIRPIRPSMLRKGNSPVSPSIWKSGWGEYPGRIPTTPHKATAAWGLLEASIGMVSCTAKTRNKENGPAWDKRWGEAQGQKPVKYACVCACVYGMTTEMPTWEAGKMTVGPG